jgi:hypothetical protein
VKTRWFALRERRAVVALPVILVALAFIAGVSPAARAGESGATATGSATSAPAGAPATGDLPAAGALPCPPAPPAGTAGTCVQVLNQWRLSLILDLISPDQGTTVPQAPPREIAPGQSGGWATIGNTYGDGARVRFSMPGVQSMISYATQTDSFQMSVTGESDPPYYCSIGFSRRDGWTYVRISYTDVVTGSQGNCATSGLASPATTAQPSATPSGVPSAAATPTAAALAP